MKFALATLSFAIGLLAAAPVSALTGPGKVAKTKTTKVTKVAEAYKIDGTASKVEWIGTKVTGKHNGTVGLQGGTLDVAGNRVTGGNVMLDMKTIKVLDLTDAEYNAKLLGHLNSDDFFSVEKHPTAGFKITSIAPLKNVAEGKQNYTVNGDLTIKGITNRISFPAIVTVNGNQVTAVGTTVVDRTKYDIKYGSGSFFDNLGDKAISNDITITFNVVAKK